MNELKKTNNLIGWILFLVSLSVYTITMEETASFWDCGEFIAVSYKLMVPHPPGAPFFLLFNRLFSFLALGNVLKVAWWINFQSAFMSALTILFLYWSIVMLGMKVLKQKAEDYVLKDKVVLFGSAAVGALAYTFSDSFWFSAVEAEVYAMSSAFTAAVFWAILKWEFIEDNSASNRWLIMIAYIIGLSIGVHLENLLCLPALAMIYYYKKYPNSITFKGTLIAMVVGGAIILGIIIIVIPGLPSMAFSVDKVFVNIFGLSFGIGGLVFSIVLVLALVYGVYYTQNKQQVTLNNLLLGVSFILVGYMSYTLVFIRSNQETPINENTPDDLLSYVSYLKREQYGERPLFYGPTYNSEEIGVEEIGAKYREANKNGKDYYEVYAQKSRREYDKKDMMLFPRLYSTQPHHKPLYEEWAGIASGEKPTMLNNIVFFFRYQLGHMYLRYFMWNFAGRESDEKDASYLLPWDDLEDLPELLQKNKARTNFYLLPLALGLLGVFYQYKKDKKNFFVVAVLFITLGVALVFYLNSPPVEPRERDYIYAASFYAFAIWIGFGVLAVGNFLSDKVGNNGVYAGVGLSFIVPIIMGINGWDGHNRSNRYYSVDQARNTLASCAENAILFTGGDNDTFPLWYVQNVEGFRTDIRVVVLSYFQADWYIKQMHQQQYESNPLPLQLSNNVYQEGNNEIIPLIEVEQAQYGVNMNAYINAIKKGDPITKVELQNGTSINRLLSKTFVLDVDSNRIAQSKLLPDNLKERVVSKMVWSLKPNKKSIYKNELALLDLIVSNNWERPIYFNNTSAGTINMDFSNYLYLEGMAFRLLPIHNENTFGELGEVNVEVMQENLKNFAFRGLQDESVYYDGEYQKMALNTRNSVYRLAEKLYYDSLLEDNLSKKKQSKKTLDWILTTIPDKTIPYSFYAPKFMGLYYKLGDTAAAEEIFEKLLQRSSENLSYYSTTGKGEVNISYSILRNLSQFFESSLKDINQRLSQLSPETPDFEGKSKEELEILKSVYEKNATLSRNTFLETYQMMTSGS
ncbi:glycosyltransferase family 117 protein [Flammeovirga kamogawensis]|uniref:DUF2723 domain-containing protein n=1 Tax=Flammeovirga kamogawensis TaxID=373891 RepID=A0ABX8GTI4_9BACT|nr:DUF2723 domain-containing protein [Flammeovirga kamogawensis]MBB6463889.1 hypothetical protein [Flammeovirga kamogawensis]QWG06587.1 DUF2723 domain-containing protein [Flammeovirga kamogawensis]TRX68413.1 DUF2723 domain-containing protein [Flammeovirga kamogawensis]